MNKERLIADAEWITRNRDRAVLLNMAIADRIAAVLRAVAGGTEAFTVKRDSDDGSLVAYACRYRRELAEAQIADDPRNESVVPVLIVEMPK